MISEDTQYMHHDARGERGPYTAHAVHYGQGDPIYCMVPEDVLIGEDDSLLRPTPALARSVGWTSGSNLHAGLRPGLHGEVGWLPVIPY